MNKIAIIEQKTLKSLIKHFKPNQKILHLMDHQAERWPWWKYKKHMITPKRIAAGKRFLQQHATALKALSTTYAIPSEYLVAIIGLETTYGENTGTFNGLIHD